MSELITATPHTCKGVGDVEMGIKRVPLEPEKLDLKPAEIDVQHFSDGSTRSICEFLERGDGTCSKLRKATKGECLIALTGKPYVEQGQSEEYTHYDGPCKWLRRAML